MKTLIFSLILLFSSTSYAFDRNLSGVWKNNGITWIIAQVGENATFSTNETTEIYGLQTITFHGSFISTGFDKFSYSGATKTVTIQVSSETTCNVKRSLSSEGYVVGQFGGRIIKMFSCQISIVARCTNRKTRTSFQDCTGDWK